MQTIGLSNQRLRNTQILWTKHYHLSQTLTFQHLILGQLILAPQRKDCITESVMESFLSAVVLTGDLNDLGAAVSGDLGFWENSFLAPQRNCCIPEIENKLFLQ